MEAQANEFEPIDSVDQAVEKTEDDRWQGLLASTITGPENLAEYLLPPGGDASPEGVEADLTIRQWMADAGLPAGIGSHIAEVADEWAVRTEGWTDDQHELERRTTMINLERLWGERTGSMIDMARDAVARLDRLHDGQVSAFLDETQLGNCPQLIAQLAMLEERRQLAGN
ncbi:hypothetical protein [Pseudomonas sp. BIC9C]|uniref:hypothetical protein n=1 Tax=Pseudomonas sp. BIC9C TaxID=3078458 RepID=UPI002AD30C97|nr:hypothetical protein [Pseudomonas sp. BIC9C]